MSKQKLNERLITSTIQSPHMQKKVKHHNNQNVQGQKNKCFKNQIPFQITSEITKGTAAYPNKAIYL